jgi:3-oxoadipate enol-lactonase
MATAAVAEAQADFHGRYLPLKGRGTTFVFDIADRPGADPVVLLHGWAATAMLNWSAVMRPVAASFRFVALDQRGHGRGIRIPLRQRFTLTDCADDVAVLLDALHIHRAILVGFSMGGAVAQLVWQRHKDRVAGLVLCSTASSFGTGPVFLREVAAAARVPAGLFAPAILPLLAHGGWHAAFDEVRHHDPRALADAGLELAAFRSEAWLSTVDVPTAVIVTLEDRLISPERQLALARSIPGATVTTVQADHLAVVRGLDRYRDALLAACHDVKIRSRR